MAEHTYGVALLAFLVGGHLGMDPGPLLSMALVHDLAEALTGDVIPRDGVAAAVKKRREEEALAIMCADLHPREAQAILTLWRRFEFGDDPEARLLRELDRLDIALQALAYEEEGLDPVSLEHLWDFVDRNVVGPIPRAILSKLFAQRRLPRTPL